MSQNPEFDRNAVSFSHPNHSNTAHPKKKKKKKRKKHTALSVFLAFCLICFLTACVVGGYVLTNAFLVIGGDPVIKLEDEKNNQNQTSFIYAYNENNEPYEYTRLHGEINRIWADYKDIPENLVDAFIALEDKRFYSHKGVDWYRLGGVISSLTFDEGASTITQQLIKNVTNNKEVTIVRKYNEILSALNLEKNYEKQDILEAYLNVVYLGSGCYGVRTAAETYFGKELKDLNLSECTVLASITKAPYSFNPLYNPEKNRERQKECLKKMLDQGYITNAEYNDALAYDLIFTNDTRYVATHETVKEEKEEVYQNFYIDFVIDQVIDDLESRHGYTHSEATKMIYYGGLRIYAAVDPEIQDILEKVYSTRSAFPNPNELDTEDHPAVQSAMTIMDYNGRVVAIVGQAGEKDGVRCLNRAADSPRQPGSSIKPLSVYAPAIDKNALTWSTIIKNQALAINGKQWPKNVDGSMSGSSRTVQYALQVSLNTVPARIVYDGILPGGISTCLDYMTNHFHLSHVDMTNDASLPPVCVGAMTYGATTLEMAAAYATFGNGGLYYKPYSYYEVKDSSGEVLLSNRNPEGEQAISEDTADVMCELLQTVPISSYGSGYTVQKFPVMCKTGTTDEDMNRWFCAGTPYYVCSIWYGYDLAKNMHTSVNPCGRIFLDVFSKIHKDLDPSKTFPKSGKTIKKAFCSRSGLLAGRNCGVGGYGWYKTSDLPRQCTSCTYSSSAEEAIKEGASQVIDAIQQGLAGSPFEGIFN